MAVALRTPTTPAVRPRRRSRALRAGTVPVGGDAPASVRSMTTSVPADVDATVRWIAESATARRQSVRVAVPSRGDADALPTLVTRSRIPLIADIHLRPRYIRAAIDVGRAAVRGHPGDISAFDDEAKESAKVTAAAGAPPRIRVTVGSSEKRPLAAHGRAPARARVETAPRECSEGVPTP